VFGAESATSFGKSANLRSRTSLRRSAAVIFRIIIYALAGKGRARAAQNDLEGAVKLLTEANNRVPNVETAILLGDVYAKLGDAEKAKQQYELVEVIERQLGVNNDQKRLAAALGGPKHQTRRSAGNYETRIRNAQRHLHG
jgi:tetratricopeptide (TPR) repeat protein